MNQHTRDMIDLLFAHRRRVEDAMTYCLKFDSEGPAKTRKLARFEGELTGVDEAIAIVNTVGASRLGVVI